VKIENFWGLKVYLKRGIKSENVKLLGTKSQKKMEGLKQKVSIFIWTKNIFNPRFFLSKGCPEKEVSRGG
jgi:hypothetical protein